jgi:hypothetical protein
MTWTAEKQRRYARAELKEAQRRLARIRFFEQHLGPGRKTALAQQRKIRKAEVQWWRAYIKRLNSLDKSN